jgi:hypothetical protein
MATPFDNIISSVAAEHQHMDAMNMCFVYFGALAETRRRGHRSDLFEALDGFKCLGADLPQDCDDATALRLRELITAFIEKCPGHPNTGYAFHTLLDLSVGDELRTYFISKLKYYYAQGDAQTVFQLCSILGDLGMDVFRDEKGAFIASRSSCEAETNMGVARRFLARLNAELGTAPNGGPARRFAKSEPSEGPPSVS